MPPAIESEAEPPEVLKKVNGKPEAYRHVLRQSRHLRPTGKVPHGAVAKAH